VKTALIIGGGFAGCAAAHQLALAGGWDVTIVEAGPFLGAGVRTQWKGGHAYTFGPRHFLTQNEKVFEFLNSYVPLRRHAEHEFLTYVEQDEAFYTYPIHTDDIARMPERGRIEDELWDESERANVPENFEEFWIAAVGRTLYGKFIDQYSRKMWGVESNTLLDTFDWSPKGVMIKSGPRAAWDTAISAYPEAPNGYDDYFGISTADAAVLFNTRIRWFDILSKRAEIHGERRQFDVIVNTISPDTLFANCHGELPFMGRDITTLILPVEFALPPNVYFCYYAGGEKYTRVTEYKKFTRHKADSTLITLEYPSHNGRLYPMPFKTEQARAKRYFDMMPDDVFSIGRAGSYDYSVDIDDCIAQAMDVAAKVS
jgi:UDP-galactopyranose mutase